MSELFAESSPNQSTSGAVLFHGYRYRSSFRFQPRHLPFYASGSKIAVLGNAVMGNFSFCFRGFGVNSPDQRLYYLAKVKQVEDAVPRYYLKMQFDAGDMQYLESMIIVTAFIGIDEPGDRPKERNHGRKCPRH
jgi:hypothetical protein